MQSTIVGNLTGDPELRFTPSGAAVSNFTVAENRRRFDKDRNEWVDIGTTFVQCAVWREAAENVAESFVKGQRIIVTGDVFAESFDRQDGSRGTSVRMNVTECGPSIRYAVAKATANQRRDGGQQQGQQQGQGQPQGSPASDPWGTTPQGQQRNGQGTPQGRDPWGAPPGTSEDPPF